MEHRLRATCPQFSLSGSHGNMDFCFGRKCYGVCNSVLCLSAVPQRGWHSHALADQCVCWGLGDPAWGGRWWWAVAGSCHCSCGKGCPGSTWRSCVCDGRVGPRLAHVTREPLRDLPPACSELTPVTPWPLLGADVTSSGWPLPSPSPLPSHRALHASLSLFRPRSLPLGVSSLRSISVSPAHAQ